MGNVNLSADIRIVTGGPLDVNTYVVGAAGSDSCVLIDPGAQVNQIDAAVGGRKVSAILLTHAHFDHILSAQHYMHAGAKLYVHNKDKQALKDPSLNLSGMVGMRISLDGDVRTVDEGDVIAEGGLEFVVLHTPGHTPGGVCLRCGDALFSGDTLFYSSYGRLDLPGGSASQMRASLKRLLALEEGLIVYPGHGIKTKIAWERGMCL